MRFFLAKQTTWLVQDDLRIRPFERNQRICLVFATECFGTWKSYEPCPTRTASEGLSKSLLATISNSHQSLNQSFFQSTLRLLQGRPRSWRDDCSVLISAGREIKKPPFDRMSWPMTGCRTIAAVAGADCDRPVRPSCRSRSSGRYRSGADPWVSGP